ncbi:MAG: motility-associated protein [Verrucomicrobiota bacterium]
MVPVGYLVTLAAVIGGFMMSGGNPGSLVVISEYVVILGALAGYVVGAAPPALIKLLISKIIGAMKGSPFKKKMYLDVISMLYELLMVAREQGVVGIEEHVVNPEASTIFTKYPSFLHDHHAVAFMQDAMRPIIDGKVKGEQMKAALEDELNRIHHHMSQPTQILTKAGDALPAIGIVAAVLGIIITMGHLGGDKQEIGHHVSSALTGTLLGIFAAYSFVQPLIISIELTNEDELAYFEVMSGMIVAYATGSPPIMAAESGRKSIPSDRKPTSEELETMLKELGRK